MEYPTCLLKCIEQLRSAGVEEAVRLMRAYPLPSADEWEECVAQVHLSGEDLTNPFHLMGCYELRLCATGVKTALSLHVEMLKKTAKDAGIPPQYINDAVKLYAVLREPGRRR